RRRGSGGFFAVSKQLQPDDRRHTKPARAAGARDRRDCGIGLRAPSARDHFRSAQIRLTNSTTASSRGAESIVALDAEHLTRHGISLPGRSDDWYPALYQ